jgi:hypothetical protein
MSQAVQFKSSADVWLVIASLKAAACVFHTDAIEARNNYMPSLGEQFDKQADDARRIAAEMEQA